MEQRPLSFPVATYPLVHRELPRKRLHRRRRLLVLATGILSGLYFLGQLLFNSLLEEADLGAVCCWALSTAILLVFLLVTMSGVSLAAVIGGARDKGMERLMGISPGLLLLATFLLSQLVELPDVAVFLLLWLAAALVNLGGVQLLPADSSFLRGVFFLIVLLPVALILVCLALGVPTIVGGLILPAFMTTLVSFALFLSMGKHRPSGEGALPIPKPF